MADYDYEQMLADHLRSMAEMQAAPFPSAPMLYGEQPRRCPVCRRWARDLSNRRLNTMYVEDASNWMLSCSGCYEMAYRNYADQWAEYWMMVM